MNIKHYFAMFWDISLVKLNYYNPSTEPKHNFLPKDYFVHILTVSVMFIFVKLRQGSGKERQEMALKAKGLKA